MKEIGALSPKAAKAPAALSTRSRREISNIVPSHIERTPTLKLSGVRGLSDGSSGSTTAGRRQLALSQIVSAIPQLPAMPRTDRHSAAYGMVRPRSPFPPAYAGGEEIRSKEYAHDPPKHSSCCDTRYRP